MYGYSCIKSFLFLPYVLPNPSPSGSCNFLVIDQKKHPKRVPRLVINSPLLSFAQPNSSITRPRTPHPRTINQIFLSLPLPLPLPNHGARAQMGKKKTDERLKHLVAISDQAGSSSPASVPRAQSMGAMRRFPRSNMKNIGLHFA